MDDNTLTAFGGKIKALGEGRVGGYLVRFTSADDPDLEDEYFTCDTDFGPLKQSAVYYHHAADKKLGRRRLQEAAALKADDVGVWIEAQLAMRDEYERAIYAMAEAGKLGWSSGTASHLVDMEQTGKARWIKSWPLGLDASLTPVAAEPRNQVVTYKAYLKSMADAIHAQLDDTSEAEAEPEADPSAAFAAKEGWTFVFFRDSKGAIQ